MNFNWEISIGTILTILAFIGGGLVHLYTVLSRLSRLEDHLARVRAEVEGLKLTDGEFRRALHDIDVRMTRLEVLFEAGSKRRTARSVEAEVAREG